MTWTPTPSPFTRAAHRLSRERRRAFIEGYEFDPALRAKLGRQLSDGRAERIALEGLRTWFLVALYADKGPLGMPSRVVDQAWHEMILCTREYHTFCSLAFGRYLHHSPESTLTAPMHALLAYTLMLVEFHALPMTLFTADTDAGVADGYQWSEEDLRSLRVARSRGVSDGCGGDAGSGCGGGCGGCGGGE